MTGTAPGSNTQTTDLRKRIVPILSRVGAFLFAVAITVGIYVFRDSFRHLASLGYIGIFLLSILANATIILPAPGVAFVFGMGAVFNPFFVALAAGAGAAIGELSGYIAGYSGQTIIQRSRYEQQLEGWMRKNGGWTILIFAFIPNPLFDIAGMIAGMLKMPLWKFLLFCWIGKTLKMFLFAYAGSLSIPWLTPD
ncbi:MAG: VTT domain-containing protein [Anaerolineales bacterium]|jgi:membrane protein DedA with SNARE-associated domain